MKKVAVATLCLLIATIAAHVPHQASALKTGDVQGGAGASSTATSTDDIDGDNVLGFDKHLQQRERTKGVTWVVEAAEHGGGKITATNPGRDTAICVDEKDLTSDDYIGARPWKYLEIRVTHKVAETLDKGGPCPKGPVIQP